MTVTTETRERRRFPLPVIAVFVGGPVFALAFSLPFLIERVEQTFSDSGAAQYEDVRYVRTRCPSLQPMVDQALSDGRLSKREAIRIGERMAEATDTWYDYRDMVVARRNLGLSVAPPPPACDNRRASGDFRVGRILEPVWIR